MLKNYLLTSARLLVSPRTCAPVHSLKTKASGADSETAETESREEGAKKDAAPKKPLPARRLAYESPPRELLFGIHPIEIALAEKRRKFYKMFVKTNTIAPHSPELTNIVEWATNLKIRIVYKRREELSHLTRDAVHQGAVMQVSRLKIQDWTEQLEIFGRSDTDGRLLVYVDRVSDPMNMGAIIRSCVFLGADAILVPRESCKLSPTVSKASSGALECATICYVPKPHDFLAFVQKLGWEILGTDSDCLPYDEYEPSRNNRLLVLGNEGHGVNDELVNFFTQTISVPGVENRVGSLNVSVTAGVLLSHFAKHKRSPQVLAGNVRI